MPRPSFRSVVDRALLQAFGPLSADESRQALIDTGIGIATVYRHLNRGVEEGRYTAIQMPNSPTRFEPASRPAASSPFRMQTCRRVYDVMGCPGYFDRLVPEDFLLESHDLLLPGQCSNCLESSAA